MVDSFRMKVGLSTGSHYARSLKVRENGQLNKPVVRKMRSRRQVFSPRQCHNETATNLVEACRAGQSARPKSLEKKRRKLTEAYPETTGYHSTQHRAGTATGLATLSPQPRESVVATRFPCPAEQRKRCR